MTVKINEDAFKGYRIDFSFEANGNLIECYVRDNIWYAKNKSKSNKLEPFGSFEDMCKSFDVELTIDDLKFKEPSQKVFMYDSSEESDVTVDMIESTEVPEDSVVVEAVEAKEVDKSIADESIEKLEDTNEIEIEDFEINKVITDEGAGKHNVKTKIPLQNIYKFIEKAALVIFRAKDKYDYEKSKESLNNIIKPESSHYTLEDFLRNVKGVNPKELKDVLEAKGALLFTGVPGTGKTVAATNLAKYITEETNSDRVMLVSFSETTSYGDAIEGIRPKGIGWGCVSGTLKQLADRACADTENTYIYIIDEINRGNTESILGEVLTAIERRDEKVITNNGNELVIPSNMYFIATMNSYDNSTKDLDMATYSRFAECEMHTNFELNAVNLNKAHLPEEVKDKIPVVGEALKHINTILVKDEIKKNENELGTRSLFCKYKTVKQLRLIVKYDILPDVKRRAKSLTKEQIKELKDIFIKLGNDLTGEPIEWEN